MLNPVIRDVPQIRERYFCINWDDTCDVIYKVKKAG